MIILVIGLRGTGKSTWCKEHLGDDGLCYDMDAIASAFRLRMPHEEYHTEARHMANDLLYGFLAQAEEYTDQIFIIRTAPSVEEIRQINPDVIVVCKKRYALREMDDEKGASNRIRLAEYYARTHDIRLLRPEESPPRV